MVRLTINKRPSDVHGDVALAAFQLLTRIITATPWRVRGLDGLAVHNACRRLRGASRLLTVEHQGKVMDGLEQHPAHEAPEPPIYQFATARSVWARMRQPPPERAM